jgi:hypothetical protein
LMSFQSAESHPTRISRFLAKGLRRRRPQRRLVVLAPTAGRQHCRPAHGKQQHG